MKICPKCSAQLADDAVFCTGCGQKMEEGMTAQAANVCKNCGSPLSSDTQFCTKCGTPVSGVSKPSTQAAAPTRPTTSGVSVEPGSPQKSSEKNPALLIGGVLIIAAIIGFFLFNSSGSGDVPKTPEDFVSAYNREIKDIAKENKVNANLISLEDVPSELNEMVSMMQAGENGGSAGGKIVMKTAGNGMIVFAGAKMKDQSLQLAFQMKNALDSQAFFAAMEGFVKASGGDVGAVMKGLGLLSGKRYNLPADYAKEFVYNKNLKYQVLSIGGNMTKFVVEAGNGDSVKSPASTTNAQQPNQQSAQNTGGSADNQTQNKLKAAENELKQYGVNRPVHATSYGHSSDGFMVLDETSGVLVLVDRNNRQVAEVTPRNMNLNKFRQSRNESYQNPIIVEFKIPNAVRDNDAEFGSWAGNTHIFPIYCQYKFDAAGNVVPGMLTSGKGKNPSHYQGVLKEQRSVDLANLFLTEAIPLCNDLDCQR